MWKSYCHFCVLSVAVNNWLVYGLLTLKTFISTCFNRMSVVVKCIAIQSMQNRYKVFLPKIWGEPEISGQNLFKSLRIMFFMNWFYEEIDWWQGKRSIFNVRICRFDNRFLLRASPIFVFLTVIQRFEWFHSLNW